MKRKVVPKLRQEVKVKVDIVTSDDIKFISLGNSRISLLGIKLISFLNFKPISLFPTMFSTQSDNCIPICPYF